MNEGKFIELSKAALNEINDPKPINLWNKEYTEKKKDPVFVKDYIIKRSKSGLSNIGLFDNYLKIIPEEERSSPFVVEMYKKEGRYLRINSFAYENLQNKHAFFLEKLPGMMNNLLFESILNTLEDAAKAKNEQLLYSAMLAYDQLPKNVNFQRKDQLYMLFYEKTGDTNKYFRYAKNYANNHLMRISIDSIQRMDSRNAKIIEKQFSLGVFGKIDSLTINKLRESFKHKERNLISEDLNKIAWKAFQTVSDTNLLKNACGWSKRSLEIYPGNSQLLETYTNLQYKLGIKK